MKLYGSLDNRFEEGRQYGELHVGMGATETLYSDRKPYEVVEVITQNKVVVSPCKWHRIDNNGMSDCQEYEYELEPYREWTGWNGEPKNNNVVLIRTKRGWKAKGEDRRFILGVKERYYDYTF